MSHDKCPVCGERRLHPIECDECSFMCGAADNGNGCDKAAGIALSQAKELRELTVLLQDAHKAWDSDKDSRVGKLLHAALNKDFRYSYRPELKDI